MNKFSQNKLDARVASALLYETSTRVRKAFPGVLPSRTDVLDKANLTCLIKIISLPVPHFSYRTGDWYKTLQNRHDAFKLK